MTGGNQGFSCRSNKEPVTNKCLKAGGPSRSTISSGMILQWNYWYKEFPPYPTSHILQLLSFIPLVRVDPIHRSTRRNIFQRENHWISFNTRKAMFWLKKKNSTINVHFILHPSISSFILSWKVYLLLLFIILYSLMKSLLFYCCSSSSFISCNHPLI